MTMCAALKPTAARLSARAKIPRPHGLAARRWRPTVNSSVARPSQGAKGAHRAR
jgi:hypothetical protein